MSGYIKAETGDLFDPITKQWVGVLDLNGNEQLGLTNAQVAALQPGIILLSSAAAGASTGWLASSPFAIRFSDQPAGISGTASIVIDASSDGVTAAQTIGIIALTAADNGLQFYTPQIIIGYPFVRVSVVADGGGTHTIARGV